VSVVATRCRNLVRFNYQWLNLGLYLHNDITFLRILLLFKLLTLLQRFLLLKLSLQRCGFFFHFDLLEFKFSFSLTHLLKLDLDHFVLFLALFSLIHFLGFNSFSFLLSPQLFLLKLLDTFLTFFFLAFKFQSLLLESLLIFFLLLPEFDSHLFFLLFTFLFFAIFNLLEGHIPINCPLVSFVIWVL
jgi:hypothetical protein